jgi:hypothetical protein
MAAVLDVIVISMASCAIVLVMGISAVVVLYEEDQKRVETDIYRSVKVLDTILKPEVVEGMFDIGDVMLRGGGNRQLNIPPASVIPLPLFPSILTNQASHISVGKHILLETVHVMLDPPDILYRGVRFAPVWVHSASEGDEGGIVGPQENDFKPTVTLRQYYDSLGSEAMAGHMNASKAELMPLGISHIETELHDTSGKALLGGTVTLANGSNG